MKIEMTCQECGEKFLIDDWIVKRQGRTVCSWKCELEKRRKKSNDFLEAVGTGRIQLTGGQKYLRFERDGKNGLLHRHVWQHFNGPIPQGYHVHHKNGDTHDNRIENLEILTVKNHHKKHRLLTEDQVREIRETAGEYGSGAKLARKYNISNQLIAGVRAGRCYKDVG